MEKILTADFSNGASQIRIRGIWQHDYGAKLKVKGIDYSTLIRVDFAGANDPKAYPVVAVQEADGTFTAKIPKEVTDQAYDINAYIYVSGNDAGYTVKQVVMPVQERVEADPASGGGTATDPYTDVLEKMKEYKTAAGGSERNAASSAEKAAEAARKCWRIREEIRKRSKICRRISNVCKKIGECSRKSCSSRRRKKKSRNRENRKRKKQRNSRKRTGTGRNRKGKTSKRSLKQSK